MVIIFHMKKVEWLPKALKQLAVFPVADRIRIADSAKKLSNFPNVSSDIKKLKGRPEYRLRVGRYRVIFTDELTIIEIQEVKKRDEHTYRWTTIYF